MTPDEASSGGSGDPAGRTVAERRSAVAELRRAGVSQRRIAAELGVAVGTVAADLAALGLTGSATGWQAIKDGQRRSALDPRARVTESDVATESCTRCQRIVLRIDAMWSTDPLVPGIVHRACS